MFTKYNSIENTYRQEFLNRIQGHGLWDGQYVVQEKAHGSNLSFWTGDGLAFTAAKRTASLSPDEKFYNHQMLLAQLTPKFQMIWKAISADRAIEGLNIFGEVIGGNYSHADIAKDKSALKVQKGIEYCPDNRFYAFDIMVDGRYLDVEQANHYFELAGLLYAKTLFQGTLRECLAHSNEFDSVIPKQLGLPTISPNICEGVIIKPLQTAYFNNGTRVILKNKNERWSENLKKKKTIKVTAPLPEKVVKLQEALATYITENRLNNVVSKIGEVTHKDFGKLLGLFNKDILEDFLKDYAAETADFDKKELKLVTKSLGQHTPKLVKAYLFR